MLVVSSGAIALGRTVLGLGKRALKLEESQAAAAVGQIALARRLVGGARPQRPEIGPDPADARRHRGAPPLSQRARHHRDAAEDGAVPVINENDTVATSEIRYGDNDRLAARVATMMGADLLVLLSDIDGLYTAPPPSTRMPQFIPLVERITPEIEAMAGAAASELSRGGMRTKIDAGKIATAAGTAMIIASGTRLNPLRRHRPRRALHLLPPSANPVTGYKTWIAGQLEPAGGLSVDAGAVRALLSGKACCRPA